MADGPALPSGPFAPETLLVGTHHKTGSVWMQGVFGAYAAAADCRLVHTVRGELVAGTRRTIVFDGHSRFDGYDRTTARGIRVVRDPRDVIVSSMHYHRRAAEPWLHTPRFGAMSYQEKITTLSDADAMTFEIDNSAGRNIAAMCAFDDGATFLTLKYEALMADTGFDEWHRALRWLGLERLDMLLALHAVLENSRFGGKQSAHMRPHAQTQWQREMPGAVLAHFEQRFPDALRKLGYDDASGVRDCAA